MSSLTRRLAVAVSVSIVMLALPAAGLAVTRQHAHAYERAYHAVAQKFGLRAPGRNIVKWGLPSHVRASDKRVVASIVVLRRMLAPPLVAAVSSSVSSYSATTSSATTSSAGAAGLPACASESGTNYSTGPDNTNASGATGRYQEMPEHRLPGGLCYGISLSPSGQDACAARIYAAQGAHAWVGCGG